MASYQVPPPKSFDFSKPEEWPSWIRRFQRFRVASGLSEKSSENQVNTLMYTMGDIADDILTSFELTKEEKKTYNTVAAKFQGHFVKKRNIIFERAKFNQHKQEEGESVDDFVTALYCLSEHCQYAKLRDEMIRDRIVVGLRNSSLSEKLFHFVYTLFHHAQFVMVVLEQLCYCLTNLVKIFTGVLRHNRRHLIPSPNEQFTCDEDIDILPDLLNNNTVAPEPPLRTEHDGTVYTQSGRASRSPKCYTPDSI